MENYLSGKLAQCLLNELMAQEVRSMVELFAAFGTAEAAGKLDVARTQDGYFDIDACLESKMVQIVLEYMARAEIRTSA